MPPQFASILDGTLLEARGAVGGPVSVEVAVDGSGRDVVERFWSAFAVRDLETSASLLSDRFEQRWPQSGELIHGPDNWLAMASSHPTLPRSRIVAIYGEGDLWVAELVFDYGDGSPPYQVGAIHRVVGGAIASTVEFFGAPFDPAEWRAAVVEVGPRPVL